MQPYFAKSAVRAVLLAFLLGCNGSPPPVPVPPGKRYAGIVLRLGGEPAAVELWRKQSAGWAGRTGGSVAAGEVTAADIVFVSPSELGSYAATRDVMPVPVEVRAEESVLRWSRILSTYRDRLNAWGPDPVAVPLAGDGYVLAYRADRFADPAHQQAFRAKTGRPLAEPASWEDVAEVAAYFAGTGAPSLPPLPDAARLLHEFHCVAACYDRPALTESVIVRNDAVAKKYGSDRALAFHHDAISGKPRLTSPGFVAAAEYLAQLHRFRTPGTEADPVKALDTGTAVVALLSLAEVGRLPRDRDAVSARFGIAPLPGTRTYCDDIGAPVPPPDRVKGVNFVPYYAGGLLAVVRSGCKSPEAAFELLADLGAPARAQELQSNPALGFGPFRAEQLEQKRDDTWDRYGLDPVRTKKLADAIRGYAAVSLANPVYGPRGPDTAVLFKLLEAELRKAARGELPPAAAMQAAQEVWQKQDATNPDAATWRRKSAGLN